MKADVASKLVASWNAPYVAREKVELFSGGMVKGKSVANADSAGIGPKGAFRLGKRKVVYPVESLAHWIADRILLDN